MSIPYYNYSSGYVGDANDSKMGENAANIGEMLEISDIRNENNTVSFIAFVNSFSQNFTSNWNTQEALGRMDDIATFKNTTRQISVTWDVPAADTNTARENLNRCNALISMLYPTYTNADTANGGSYIMSKPPLVRIRYANLIANTAQNTGLKGYITSLSWTPVLEMGSFHSAKAVYPRVITLSIEFTALHEPIGKGGPTGYFNDENSGLMPSSGYGSTDANNASGTKLGWPFGGITAKNPRKNPALEDKIPDEPPVDDAAEAEDAEDKPLSKREQRQKDRQERRQERRDGRNEARNAAQGWPEGTSKDERKRLNQKVRQDKRLAKIKSRGPTKSE